MAVVPRLLLQTLSFFYFLDTYNIWDNDIYIPMLGLAFQNLENGLTTFIEYFKTFSVFRQEPDIWSPTKIETVHGGYKVVVLTKHLKTCQETNEPIFQLGKLKLI